MSFIVCAKGGAYGERPAYPALWRTEFFIAKSSLA